MTLIDPTDARPVHFMGIAGAGMSALAELVVRRGVRVTGCDLTTAGTEDLARLGIPLVAGHDPAHTQDARALVVTAAVPQDHPELARARALGLPVIKRAEALGDLTRGRELVGVAGTHGKTTTTVMTADALAAAGREPTALAGGRVSAWGGNLRPGADRLYVVEADEYDRSFLTLAATVAVVTNIEADHLDIYKDLRDIRAAFAQFVRGARTVVLCADDPGANTLPTRSSSEVIRYGIDSGDARLLARDPRTPDGRFAFAVEFDGERLGELSLAVPGRHNALNALAAVASGLSLGAQFASMAPAIGRFSGVGRRFEHVGDARGVRVIDDYAHHPTEIAATLAAARGAFPGRRLVVAFQPHLFSRTRDFAADFGAVLAAADVLFLTEIYAAREQPIPGVTADLIADAVKAAGGRLAWRGPRAELADALAATAREGDVVVVMGAGDITKTGRELLERLGGDA
ncbi:MAG: UDP-N-acetylmuramate--L-alanine ligase [Gemmatimonadaceae bacterium]